MAQSDQERLALHAAIQNIVREFESDGVIVNCALTLEVVDQSGCKRLIHKSFNIEGEDSYPWTVESLLRDHLREVDVKARSVQED
jgi:hypothetical protein